MITAMSALGELACQVLGIIIGLAIAVPIIAWGHGINVFKRKR